MAERDFKQQNSVQHKCPNCGAPLKYDPESGKLQCEHCDSLVAFEKSNNVVEREFEELVTFANLKESDVTCYRCANCGAVVVSPRTSLATSCPYCSSPVVIDDQTGSLVQPDSVIPFELTQKQATRQLAAWRKRKWFAPSKFRKTSEDCLRGVFVPAWTFDAETVTRYEGTVGYHRTRTVRRNGKTYTESYTEWRHIHGNYEATFDDVFVRANDNVPESVFQALRPFPQSKYLVFDHEYLAGYIADHYTLEPSAAFEQAKNKMRANIKRGIIRSHHADVEGTLDVDMRILSKSFKYILIPIYIAATKFGKKLYNQYVSGIFCDKDNTQAKVCGNAPKSFWKIFLTVLLGVGAVVGLVFLLMHALGFGGGLDFSSQLEDIFQWYFPN